MPVTSGAGSGNQTTQQEMHVDHMKGQQQRKRPAGEGEPAVTLSAIQETFRSELVAAVGGMQSDIRTPTGRMDQVEGQVTTKLQQTINLLDDMTSKYYKQENILQQMQEADREFDERFRRLEQKGASSDTDPSGASTTDTGGERRAALIQGRIPSAKQNNCCKTSLSISTSERPSSPEFAEAYAVIPVPDRPGNPRRTSASASKQPSAGFAKQQWRWGPSPQEHRNSPGSHCHKAQHVGDEPNLRGKSKGCG